MLLKLLRHNTTLFIAGCAGIAFAYHFPIAGTGLFVFAFLLRTQE